MLRWALYDAAQAARRPSAPDRGYYDQAAERLGRQPRLSRDRAQAAATQLNTLRELGEEALQPA